MNTKTRDRLLQGTVGLIVAVIMVFVGYYLNSHLAREILSIEYVEIKTYLEPLELPREQWQELMRNESFMFHLTGLSTVELDLLQDQMPKIIPYDNEHDIVARILQGFLDEQRTILQHITSFFDKFDALTVKDVDDFVTFMHIHNLRLEVPYPLTLSNKMALKKPTNSLRKTIEPLIRTVELLMAEVQKYQPKRTGLIEIDLTLLNSGNTDGLVRPDAKLVLKPNNISIPLSGEIAQIPKHSMVTLSFWINEEKLTAEKDLQIRSPIINGEAIPINIELEDVRGKKIALRPKVSLPAGIKD